VPKEWLFPHNAQNFLREVHGRLKQKGGGDKRFGKERKASKGEALEGGSVVISVPLGQKNKELHPGKY